MLIIKASGLFPKFDGLFGITAAYYLIHTSNQFLIQVARGYEKVKEIGVAGVIGTVVMIAANIILLLLVKAGLKGFFFAMILGQAVPIIYLLWKLDFTKTIFAVTRLRFNNSLCREMLSYSVPLIATSLGWWVNSTSDRYIVAFICGVGANGLLSVAYKIPAIINTLQGIFIQAWQISAIKEYGSKDKARFYGNAFSALNVMMAIACSVLILLTRPIAHLLFAKGFFIAWQYVPFLLVSCVANSASGFLGPVLSAKKDSKSAALSAIYGAIANLVLNVALVYVLGIQGACIATVIASWIIYYSRKKSLNKEIVIDRYSSVLLIWALLCLQAVIEIYTSLWYLEVLLLALLLFISRKEIRKIQLLGMNYLKSRKHS